MTHVVVPKMKYENYMKKMTRTLSKIQIKLDELSNLPQEQFGTVEKNNVLIFIFFFITFVDLFNR